ncbi:MAG: hypothetical protein JW782_03650 [Candidatus Saganbacteria bacterium]|nr:hypothetical protein [Candidatus Saganbacteria bacterium]
MRHLEKIGTCYSGLLSPSNSRYGRIVLATAGALRRVKASKTLQRVIHNVNDPHFSNSPAYAMHYLVKEDFVTNRGVINVGLRLAKPESEAIEYQTALDTLISMARGIHRRVLLLSFGLQVAPEIDTLRPDQYAAILADISERQQDPTFKNIAEIGLSETAAFHVIKGPEEAKQLIYSIQMLGEAPTWAHWEKVQ